MCLYKPSNVKDRGGATSPEAGEGKGRILRGASGKDSGPADNLADFCFQKYEDTFLPKPPEFVVIC